MYFCNQEGLGWAGGCALDKEVMLELWLEC